MTAARRNVDDLLEDAAEAIDAVAELVALGKERWDVERPLRLAGEAVVGRLGDIATLSVLGSSSASSTLRATRRPVSTTSRSDPLDSGVFALTQTPSGD